MRYFWWNGHHAQPITAATADQFHKHSDAGLDTAFVIFASNRDQAERGAKLWLENRADPDEPNTPDGIGLTEREPRVGKAYIILTVDI